MCRWHGVQSGGLPRVIDEVRIYDQALSEEEIKALVSSLSVREGLVACFSFDNVDEGGSIVVSVVGGY